jgi:hypothetical protein
MVAAAIAAAAAVASAGAGIYGALNTNTRSAQQAADYTGANLQNARDQQQYQAMLNAIALQRSTAGYGDSLGTTQKYDPYTNQWTTTLGALPQQQATSQALADISRNTTDMRTAQTANQDALSRSLTASDASDTAMRAIRAYNPMTPGGLTGALIERTTNANRAVQDPLVADTLRQYARMGTSAGPVLSQLQRESADGLRKSIIDSTIAGYTNAGSINRDNMASLLGKYSTLNANATPSFNYPGIASDDTNKTLANLAAYRAAQGGKAASDAAGNVPGMVNATTLASSNAAKNVVDSNFQANQINNLGKGFENLVKSGTDLYKSFGIGSKKTDYTTPQYSVGFGDGKLYNSGGVF